MYMKKYICRLTGEQVYWFGLDCGYLKAGAVADLNILDPAQFYQIKDKVEEGVIEEFGDYSRLVNRNPGVVPYVLVGGEISYQADEFVEGYGKSRKFGRFLRSTEVVA